MDIIETCPQMPLTTATLAMQCHVSVRTLQEGFRRHLGMSPMAYLWTVRLRHAHRDLRSANPAHVTVASIAHRWGCCVVVELSIAAVVDADTDEGDEFGVARFDVSRHQNWVRRHRVSFLWATRTSVNMHRDVF
jgi:Helix-turn-helix domain